MLSASILGQFSPTELRLFLIVGNTFLFMNPQVIFLGRRYLLFDIGGTVAVILMTSVLAVSTIRHARRLYSLEKI